MSTNQTGLNIHRDSFTHRQREKRIPAYVCRCNVVSGRIDEHCCPTGGNQRLYMAVESTIWLFYLLLLFCDPSEQGNALTLIICMLLLSVHTWGSGPLVSHQSAGSRNTSRMCCESFWVNVHLARIVKCVSVYSSTSLGLSGTFKVVLPHGCLSRDGLEGFKVAARWPRSSPTERPWALNRSGSLRSSSRWGTRSSGFSLIVWTHLQQHTFPVDYW